MPIKLISIRRNNPITTFIILQLFKVDFLNQCELVNLAGMSTV